MPDARRYFAQLQAGEKPWNSIHPSELPQEVIDKTEIPDAFVAPIAKAPVVLVVSVDLTVVAALDQDLDRVGIAGGASVYPLIWNILLAARSEGYGGTITTMAIAAEDEVRSLLGIPALHAVAAVVPLGKPVRQLSKLRRRPVAEFITRDRFDGPAFSR
jgi:nitroreductase